MATNKTSPNRVVPIVVGILVGSFLLWLLYDTSKLIIQVKEAMTQPNPPTNLEAR